MVQKNTQDTPSPERKSIRDIPIPRREDELSKPVPFPAHSEPVRNHISVDGIVPPHEVGSSVRRKKGTSFSKEIEAGQPNLDDDSVEHESDEFFVHSSKKIWAWGAGVVGALIIGFFIASAFAHAHISIVRANETVTLSSEAFLLVSVTEATTSDANLFDQPTQILYKTTTFEVNASTSVYVQSQSVFASKATGNIIIYNMSGVAQKLVENTRLETPEGLIYRLTTTLTVPAATTVGKKTTAGSIPAGVAADQTGKQYNSDPKDFTFPGFKGIAKYKTVYARSVGALAGGGTPPSTSPSSIDPSAIKGSLQSTLHDMGIEKALASTPQDYIFIPDAINITYGDVNQNSSQSAKVTAYFLEKKSLAAAIAKKSDRFAAATTTDIGYTADTSSLKASFLSGDQGNIYFTGTSTVALHLDPQRVANAVSHLSRDQALRVIQGMPGIEAVEISLIPWWEQTLPGAHSVSVDVQ